MKEQQEEDERILLDNRQRTRPAAKANRLTRELLEATTVLSTSETVLAWYRKLIARKYDGREHEGNHGETICIERLGGLLKSCHHKAA